MNWTSSHYWIVRLAGLGAASAAVLLALRAYLGEFTASGGLLAAIAIPVLLSLLFAPRPSEATGRALLEISGWCAGTLCLATAAAVQSLVDAPTARFASALSLGFLILFTAHAAAAVLQRLLIRSALADAAAREWSTWSITALLWLSAAAPLWLGPLADVLARTDAEAASKIVALSPVSHLAVATGHDLLRNQWFYAHSPIGSLQFEYPAAPGLFMSYIAAAAVLALLIALIRAKSPGTAAMFPSNVPLEHAR